MYLNKCKHTHTKGKSNSSGSIEKTNSDSSEKASGNKMSLSSDNLLTTPQLSEAALNRQLECANDEIRLLRNKLARLEDDLSSVTQERDNFSLQLEKIEDKAMKTSFDTSELLVDGCDKESELELDATVIKQMGDLKKKIGKIK